MSGGGRARTRIGLFSSFPSAQITSLQGQLERLRPGCARVFSLARGGMGRALLDARRLLWDGENLGGLHTVFVHGLSFADPVVPEADTSRDFSLWQCGHILREQEYSFTASMLMELAARGVRVINPFSVLQAAFSRGQVLQRLRAAGLPVARCICTNDPGRARSLAAEAAGPLLWRPATGSARWQILGPKQEKHLLAPGKPPVLLAACAEGVLVRAYVFGGKPLLCLEATLPDCEGLEVLERVRAVEPTTAARELLTGATEQLGCAWAQLLYLRGPDDACTLYDVDPDPVYDWLPGVFLDHLNARLARALLGLRCLGPAAGSELDEFTERPTPLLRRMLRILFQMEASKHED